MTHAHVLVVALGHEGLLEVTGQFLVHGDHPVVEGLADELLQVLRQLEVGEVYLLTDALLVEEVGCLQALRRRGEGRKGGEEM